MAAIDISLLIDPTKYDQIDYVGNQHHVLETAQNDVLRELVTLVDGLAPCSGSGSPEGAVDGNPGRFYTDISVDPPSIWVKMTALGDLTGWRQVIA